MSRILHEVNVRGLLRNEHFGFLPRNSTSLQLARLVEIITRNFGEKRLTGAVFPRRCQSLRYRLVRTPTPQANTRKFPVLLSLYKLLLPPGSDDRSVLPDNNVISSRHAGRCDSGWIDLPCTLYSLCQRHALILESRRVSPLRRRHGHHSHVSQADSACQLPRVISQ